MSWSENGEVALVERADDGYLMAFCERHQATIYKVESGIGILGEDFFNTKKIRFN